MPNDIKPVLKLISDYLGAKERPTEKFVIPEYQRKYSWTKQECDKLWQDIEAYKDSGQKEPYFFGTVIAACSILEPDRICLIDGQQRTTTFILLLKALLLRMKEKLDSMEDNEDARRLKVAMDGESYGAPPKILLWHTVADTTTPGITSKTTVRVVTKATACQNKEMEQ